MPSPFIRQNPDISPDLMGCLARMQTFLFQKERITSLYLKYSCENIFVFIHQVYDLVRAVPHVSFDERLRR